ncbi:restriction endonuclease subunit S [Staphylococcus saprophyticus]|nr:restriction endonuclease subunit S [Staphylococcus saprophyticus]
MTNETKNVPELRFPEFDGEWEENKINKFLKESIIVGSKGNKAKKLTVKLWGKGVVPKKEVHSGSNNTQYYIRKNGQLMYGKLDFLNCAFGIVPYELDGYESTIDSPAFDIIDGEPKFILEKIKQKSFYKKYGERANGSRKAKRINQNDFLDMTIYSPKYFEQKKIGQFFSKLDRQIELEEQKLEKLEEQKKGYMQQIFSQHFRFKDENENKYEKWRKIKLANILKERKTYLSKSSGVAHATLSTEGIYLKNERYDRDFLVKDKNKKYKVSFKDDICYNPANLKFGVITRNDIGKVIFSPIYITFEVNQNYNPLFMEMMLTRWDFINKVRKFEEGTVYERMAVKPEDFLSYETYIPCLEEQEKIGNFFNDLDKFIEKQSNKIELLKERKRGFLQKMFV